MILTGAGQIGMAIARRLGYGMKIVIGDRRKANADATAVEMDLSSRESIRNMINAAEAYGPVSMLVNAAGVSPSQAPIETILKVDLYGTTERQVRKTQAAHLRDAPFHHIHRRMHILRQCASVHCHAPVCMPGRGGGAR